LCIAEGDSPLALVPHSIAAIQWYTVCTGGDTPPGLTPQGLGPSIV